MSSLPVVFLSLALAVGTGNPLGDPPPHDIARSALIQITPGFRLQYKVLAYGARQAKSKHVSGTYTLIGADGRMKLTIEFPNYKEETWFAKRKESRKSTVDFSPTRVEQLKRSLASALKLNALEGEKAHKRKSQKVDGELLSCEVDEYKLRRCFSADGELRFQESVGKKTFFGSWQQLGPALVPRFVRLIANEDVAIEATLATAEIEQRSKEEFTAPEDAISVFDCEGVFRHAQLIFQPIPEFTEEARKKHVQGTVGIGIEIAKDGKTAIRSVIDSIPELDPGALNAVSSYRFKPATCDAKPVTSYASVEVDFRSY